MGMGEEHYDLFGNGEFSERIDELRYELENESDDSLLERAISIGEELDDFKPFPAYSIALKIQRNGWRLTEKQRMAFTGCLAYRIAEKEREE